MKDHLEYVFSNVNDWLKFAEAKSATLLAANGVVLFGILRLVNDLQLKSYVSCVVGVGCIFFVISLLLCLSSFIPSLSFPWVHKKHNKTKQDNLLFFGHIENYTPNSYLKAVRCACGTKETDENNYCYMLSQQIITNSVIASYKYSAFKKSIILTIAGVVVFVISAVLQIWT